MAESRPMRQINVPRTGLVSLRGHVLHLLISALLLALAFPGVGWWPLAYIALVPAGIAAIRTQRPKRLAWTGLVVFTAWWLLMVRWLIPVTLGGYVALSLLQGAYFTLALLVLRLLHRRFNLASVIALPLAWVSVELVRVNFPAGGFAWFVLGHSQAAYLPGSGAGRVVQVADLFGEHAVSIVVAMTNGLLLDLLTRPIMRPRPRPRNKGGLGVDRAMRAGALLWVVVFVGSLIYGQVRLGQFDSATQPGPKITVVQTHVPQSNKTQPKTDEEREAWRLAQEEDWAKLLGWTIAAAEQHPDLIAWPETVVPKPVNAEARAFEVEREISWGPTIYHETIADLAARKGVNLIVGAPAYVELDVDAEGYIHGRRSNAALFYDAQGVQAFERYDKIHRVPFGEYIPWVDSIPPLKNLFIRYLTPYSQDYTLVRGDSYTVFTARELSPPAEGQTPGTFSFVTPICYEDASPRVVRRMLYTGGGRKRADLIVNLTNSAWYAGDNQRLQHLQIATLRCIENRVPAARSVNTGISAFIDSAGRVTHAVEENGRMIEIDGIATDRVRLDTRTTFYGRLGNVPITLLALATGLLVLVALIRRGKMPGRHRLATRETR